MKTNSICSFLLIIAFTATSCNKEFPDGNFEILDYSVSDCKSQDGVKGIDDPEYITLKTIDNYYLSFNHINSLFNCYPGQITITPGIVLNTITLDENESQAGYNCICPYNISCKIGPLHYGTYTIVFQKGGLTFKEYSLDFKKSTDIKIPL